ncbi:hypothetical protein D3C71_1262540 [compost metagenome]
MLDEVFNDFPLYLPSTLFSFNFPVIFVYDLLKISTNKDNINKLRTEYITIAIKSEFTRAFCICTIGYPIAS